MHSLLARQLRRLGLDPDAAPTAEAWRAALERVSATYQDHDLTRLRLERSLELTSAEMQELHAGLAAQRDRLEEAIASFGHGLVVLDADARVEHVNPEATRLLGWSEPELAGQPLFERLAPARTESTGPLELADIVRTGRSCRIRDALFRRRNGDRLPVSFALNSVTRGGAVTGAYLVFEDIRHHKQAEEALVHARIEAERADRAKSEFLANTSHEVRTPLNIVLGMLGFLAESSLDPAQREQVELARRSGESLLRILDDVLDLSRIEAGQLTLVAEPFEWRAIEHDLCAEFAPQAAAKGVAFRSIAGAALPGRFVGDAARIRQVLWNLVGNAVKFTDHGAVTLTFSAALPAPGACELRVSVRDTGVGISEAVRPRLFEKFRQADGSDTRRHGGTGLGLAISKRLVEMMDGAIAVTSEPGAGSEFTITLPLTIALETAPAASPAPELAPFDGTGLRVLVVEDTPVNQKITVRMLERLGFEADVAENGAEGVRAFETRAYALVLMDCQMPVMDGFEACRRIRALESGGRRTPVVALSANGLERDRRRCEEAGMDGFLAKPLRPDALNAELTRRLATPGSAAA